MLLPGHLLFHLLPAIAYRKQLDGPAKFPLALDLSAPSGGHPQPGSQILLQIHFFYSPQ